jgi:uncharacterized protein YlxP (DUF503 family)
LSLTQILAEKTVFVQALYILVRDINEINMVAGLGSITFRLHDCHSLKGKRKIVKSIISRLRNNFNVSVAEVESNDVYQRAVIGFALVGNNRKVINSKIDKIFNLADELNLAEIIDSEMEIINL